MTKEELERALTKSEAERRELMAEIAALKNELCKQVSQKDDLSVKLQAATAPIWRDTYNEAVKAYGKQSQLIMAMEETAELTKELSKSTGARRTPPLSLKKWQTWKSCWNSLKSFSPTVQRLIGYALQSWTGWQTG